MNSVKILLAAFGLLAATIGTVFAEDVIEYEKFTLDNGLTVIVHEDRKSPVVAVSVWYHVGSKNEPEGKTGFAHLFEHIMFRGSENFSGNFAQTLKNIGATGTNGTTNFDRTNYFSIVPTAGLDLVLWLESDRMGHLLGAVTQKVLDEERGIVRNEKREREGQPYGRMPARIMANLFPDGHPYHHSTVGSMEDLNAASLEDVHSWFRAYYGAANAVIVLAGDIDTTEARSLVEKHFGEILSGPSVEKMKPMVPTRTENVKDTMTDKVTQTVLSRNWVVSPRDEKDKVYLDVLASILNGGKSSRLYKRFIEGDELATGVGASITGGELAGTFNISIEVKSGVAVADVEAVLDSVVAGFLDEGPTEKEMSSFKKNLEAGLPRQLDDISTKAVLLAQGELFAGGADFVNQDIEWTRTAGPGDVRAAARTWLSKGYYQLTVTPVGATPGEGGSAGELDALSTPDSAAAANATSDKEAGLREPSQRVMPTMPTVNDKLELPEVHEAVLSNGISIVAARHADAPAALLSIFFDGAGSLADRDFERGAAGLTFGLMTEGPKDLDREEFIERMETLGAQFTYSVGRHNAFASLSSLKRSLGASIQLWADSVRRPAFHEEDVERARVTGLKATEEGRQNPESVAGRILNHVLYGQGHPYTDKWNDEEALKAIQVSDLSAFHGALVRPENAHIFVVGDIEIDDVVSQLELAFGDWKSSGTALKQPIVVDDARVESKSRIILVDWADAEQTLIMAGQLIPSSKNADDDKFATANSIFGGGMTARLGSNLRIQKGWTYGIGSGARPALDQRLWQIGTSVQSDKTVASVVEIKKELEAFVGDRPVTEEELSQAVNGQILSLPGVYKSAGAIHSALMASHNFGWPYDRLEGYSDRLEALTAKGVRATTREYFRPETLNWVLVGDLSLFESEIRALKLGDVEVWNTEGKRVK